MAPSADKFKQSLNFGPELLGRVARLDRGSNQRRPTEAWLPLGYGRVFYWPGWERSSQPGQNLGPGPRPDPARVWAGWEQATRPGWELRSQPGPFGRVGSEAPNPAKLRYAP